MQPQLLFFCYIHNSFITMFLEPANQKMFFVVSSQSILSGLCK